MLSSVNSQRQARSEFYETFKANKEIGRKTQNVGVTGILFDSKANCNVVIKPTNNCTPLEYSGTFHVCVQD